MIEYYSTNLPDLGSDLDSNMFVLFEFERAKKVKEIWFVKGRQRVGIFWIWQKKTKTLSIDFKISNILTCFSRRVNYFPPTHRRYQY